MLEFRFFVLAAILALAGCSRQPPELATYCQDNLSRATTILVVDRTTRWDNRSQQKFETGIDAMFGSRDAIGLMKYVEIRDSEAGTSITQLDPCILPSSADDYRVLRPQDHAAPTMMSWLFGSTCEPYDDPNGDIPLTEDCEPLRSTGRMLDISDAESAKSILLAELPAAPPPTYPTELARTLASIVHDGCADTDFCSLFIFSDMIDSAVYRKLESGVANPFGYGKDVAAQSSRVVGRYPGRLFVIAWGLGRSDFDPTTNIPSEMQRRLEEFWRGYFSGLAKNRACLSFGDIGPATADKPLSTSC